MKKFGEKFRVFNLLDYFPPQSTFTVLIKTVDFSEAV